MLSWFCRQIHREFILLASSSAFQPVFVGLCFRVIPALGSFAHQFQPGRVSVSPAEFTPAESDRSVRVAEIYATSILALDRSDKQPTPEAVDTELGDEPAH
jgi:hypothetical protein